MKNIIYNKEKLTEKEIDETVIRVKALIINSKDEILLGYAYKTYQFPGGHLEGKETLEEALKREVREETGIEIDNKNIQPFEKITYYSSNYRDTGLNRKNEIYYYLIKTDEKPNYNNLNLDEREIKGNYELKYISIENIEKVLINSIPDRSINKIIVEEMMEVLNEFKKNYR
ncbi:MAG: NUDIX hydrolase [Bacilli bacterium]|nr:NUDIX hydrolase [Bacilli bacterium]